MTGAEDCPDGRRDGRLSRRSGWAVLFWTPVLLIGPVADLGSADPRWFGWATVVVTLGLAVAGLVVPSGGPEAALLVVRAGVTVAAALVLGASWLTLLVLLAVAAGTAAGRAWAPYAVAAAPVAAVAVAALLDESWDGVWTTGLATFLSGAGTYAYFRLFVVIAELDRTRRELARAAVSEERLRFSRDLHDLLGHTLSVIVVKAEAVRRLVPRDADAAARHAGDIEEIGRRALAEIRQAAAGYRGARLAVELERADAVLAAAGVAATVAPAPDDLPAEVDALLSWVVREGVTNVVRHAGARQCVVALDRDGEVVTLEVADDGGGRATRDGAIPGPPSPDGTATAGTGPPAGTTATWTDDATTAADPATAGLATAGAATAGGPAGQVPRGGVSRRPRDAWCWGVRR